MGVLEEEHPLGVHDVMEVRLKGVAPLALGQVELGQEAENS